MRKKKLQLDVIPISQVRYEIRMPRILGNEGYERGTDPLLKTGNELTSAQTFQQARTETTTQRTEKPVWMMTASYCFTSS